MDSPALQQHTSAPVPTSASSRQSTPRVRSSTGVDARGAIHKRAHSRARTISASQSDRLYRLAAEQQQHHHHIHSPEAHHAALSHANANLQWLTPQHSPVPSALSADPSVEPFPVWTVPTPPRSDSGIPTVSLDANDDPVVTSALCTSAEFNEFEHPTASAEMSSLGYLLPSQYGSGLYDSEPNSYPMDQSYMPPMRMSQPAATSGAAAYAQTATSSPAFQNGAPRRPDMPASQHSYARMSSNGYDSPASNYSVAPGQTIPSISGLTHSPLPSPPMSSSGTPMMPQQYAAATSMPRSPNLYDQNVYAQPFTSAPAGPQMYAPVQGMGYPPQYVGSSVNDMMAKSVGGDGSIRVLNQRPKPQCWDHGCNGRQFSTFSNLLRHQREKSGTANKAYCPKCGAEFTRTTARNGHLAHDKCTKNRRATDSK